MHSETEATPLKVFISYAHEDAEHKEVFCDQLIHLQRHGWIAVWDDGAIKPGKKWLAEIETQLDQCDIAVFLVTQKFLRSDFIWSVEFRRLMDRHAEGSVEIFPVILKECSYRQSEIAQLQRVPSGNLAVLSHSREGGLLDKVWVDVGDAFAALVDRLRDGSPVASRPPPTGAEHAPAKPEPERRYASILEELEKGKVAFFIGEGVNCPTAGAPQSNKAFPPLGADLARAMAETYALGAHENVGLAEVAQRVAVREGGEAPIHDDLHRAFDADFDLTDVHRGLARLTKAVRASERTQHQPVFLTVNYDDLLERAFAEEGVPLDVLSYVVDENGRSYFSHLPPGGVPVALTRPNEYVAMSSDAHPLLLKLAGTVDRSNRGAEHFVVTEDDHFSYAVDQSIRELLPPTILTRLQRSRYVFLGHSLSHWTLRSIISRVFARGRLPARSWVVAEDLDEQDLEFWNFRNAMPLQADVCRFASELAQEFADVLEARRS